jgi:pSer/pThr/pTyr-binding forkhead associated (FHA) protein
VYCPECGHHNRDQARFCGRCGAALIEPTEAETTMSFTPPADAGPDTGVMDAVAEGPTLVIRLGAGRTGDYYSVAGDRTTIGRAPECDVFLDDVTVSREHAVLERHPDGIHVRDLGSLNGT